MKTSKIICFSLALLLCGCSVSPATARGFGGFGGGRSFGGFGGGRSFGGGERSFGGGERSFGGFGGDRGFAGERSSGGGERSFGGLSSGERSFGGGEFGGGEYNHGVGGYGSWGSHASEGGFGHIAGYQNHAPINYDHTSLTNQGTSVRNSFNNDFNHYNQYNFNHYGGYGGWNHYGAYGWNGWHGWSGHYGWGYPGVWYVPGWSTAAAWTFAGVSSLGAFLGMADLAMLGGSGGNGNGRSASNVTYNSNNVYVNGQPVGNAEQYYTQAQQLARSGITNYQQPAPAYADADGENVIDEDPGSPTDSGGDAANWRALGVFSLATPGQTSSNQMLQLAINKDGILRGNYYNQLTNETSEVYGALDKKTQRVSWTIGNNTATVFDAGLVDLTKKDSSVLVHYGPNSTERMALIRLEGPPGKPGEGTTAHG